MNGLFLRFYVGVVFILFVAWLVHLGLTIPPTDESNGAVIETAMSGSVRLTRLSYEQSEPSERVRTLELIKQQFEFPVDIVSVEQVPFAVQNRLQLGDEVICFRSNRLAYVVGRLSDPTNVVLLGPLPQLIQQSRLRLVSGMAMVLLIAAAAIFIMLRPVNRQLHELENAANSFANGQLNRRLDEETVGPLQNIAIALNHLAARTESLLKTQQELMQGVSHELKAPLSRIQFAVELLQAEDDPEKIQHRIRVIHSGANELEDMVNRLLQYVRTDAPRSSSPNWRVPLEPIVQQIFDGERLLHSELTYELDPRVVSDEITVLSNVNDLTCVISNTVRNASRFANQRILILAYRTAKGIIIDIEDDGPGIPEKHREAVFRPFERLSDAGGSAGLGLALVGRILKRHGGWAKIETSSLGGCRIRTFWPKQPPPSVL